MKFSSMSLALILGVSGNATALADSNPLARIEEASPSADLIGLARELDARILTIEKDGMTDASFRDLYFTARSFTLACQSTQFDFPKPFQGIQEAAFDLLNRADIVCRNAKKTLPDSPLHAELSAKLQKFAESLSSSVGHSR